MSSCQCCLKPLPQHLLERYGASIQSIKIIRKNSILFEQFQSEYFEQIISNFNKYFIKHRSSSSLLLTNWSRLIRQLNQSRKYSDQLEYIIHQCSIWLKTNRTRKLRRQLKSFHRQFESLQKSKKGFAKFRSKYDRQVLQMDAIESEHLKIFQQSFIIFSSILSLDYSLNTIDIQQFINQWKEQNRFHIPWLTNEHQSKEKILPLSPSEIEIKPMDDSASQDTFAYTSNLSWSFTNPTLSVGERKSFDWLEKNCLDRSLHNQLISRQCRRIVFDLPLKHSNEIIVQMILGGESHESFISCIKKIELSVGFSFSLSLSTSPSLAFFLLDINKPKQKKRRRRRKRTLITHTHAHTNQSTEQRRQKRIRRERQNGDVFGLIFVVFFWRMKEKKNMLNSVSKKKERSTHRETTKFCLFFFSCVRVERKKG